MGEVSSNPLSRSCLTKIAIETDAVDHGVTSRENLRPNIRRQEFDLDGHLLSIPQQTAIR
jgi:hypothetical protein